MASDVLLDPAAAHPELTTLRSALAAQNWPACKALLDVVEPATRTRLISLVCEEPGVEPLLRAVMHADPDDGAAGAMLGMHLTRVGWAARTTRRAKYVSRDQFAAFHDWLTRAERVLVDAAARNPQDPAVATARLPTARGLGLGLAEARRRYDNVARAAAHHLPAQSYLVQQLCPKWGGSWEEVHAFAREAMTAAPPGSFSAVLVVEAHIEHGLDLVPPARDAYLTSAALRSDLHEAAHHSVWNPSFRRTVGWVGVMNAFAMAFVLAGDKPAARSMFQALGPFADEWPWRYLGDPVQEFVKARAAS